MGQVIPLPILLVIVFAVLVAVYAIIVGITMYVHHKQRKEAKIKDRKPPKITLRKRYHDAVDVFPTGVRVMFFIPFSILFWVLIALLFDLGWTNLPEANANSIGQYWNLIFLPIGIWLAWLVIWPADPGPTPQEVFDETQEMLDCWEARLTDAVADEVKRQLTDVGAEGVKRQYPA